MVSSSRSCWIQAPDHLGLELGHSGPLPENTAPLLGRGRSAKGTLHFLFKSMGNCSLVSVRVDLGPDVEGGVSRSEEVSKGNLIVNRDKK